MTIILIEGENCPKCEQVEDIVVKIAEEKDEDLRKADVGDEFSQRVFEEYPSLVPTTCRVGRNDEILKCSTGKKEKEALERELYGGSEK